MTFNVKVIKVIKAPHPHPPPQGGGLGLLAALDIINNRLSRGCLRP